MKIINDKFDNHIVTICELIFCFQQQKNDAKHQYHAIICIFTSRIRSPKILMRVALSILQKAAPYLDGGEMDSMVREIFIFKFKILNKSCRQNIKI